MKTHQHTTHSTSVEPRVALRANSWLRGYGLDVKLEQASPNEAIKNALAAYASKGGLGGGNRPDAQLLLQDSGMRSFPVLIEYKGQRGRLVKLDAAGQVENTYAKTDAPHWKNIKDYAVNGAVHYANAILQYTEYTDVIAIGMTGWEDAYGELRHEIGAYYVAKSNFGAGQKIGEYADLSFLKRENFDAFVGTMLSLSLSEAEVAHIKEQREREITTSLTKLNNDIFKEEEGISQKDRIYLVAATIMTNIGVPGVIPPLEVRDLLSREKPNATDGDIMMDKVRAFLEAKNIPADKKDLIITTLSPTITNEIINKPQEGTTQLKRVFKKIVDDLGIYYKIGLTTDFTGKLFNEMYKWFGWTKDVLNDVVLTPSYVGTLLARLARVDMNSYVWDFATGSAGLLVAAMNEMLSDAKSRIASPDALRQKEAHIKAEQLLGVEILPEIYMLAIINMILMGDGSSHILQADSLAGFNGGYSVAADSTPFPATAFVLNPPYSKEGKGMVFVARALTMMHSGYAAILIQNSAGAGKAKEYNVEILRRNTLLASIKMPFDLFVGKSSVQTYVYVFQVGIRHNPQAIVKFIDFSNDGYKRANRKKAKASVNLSDVDHARERYKEVVDLVYNGRSRLHYLRPQDYYEGTIDPTKGDDWNQAAPIDAMPTLADFKKTVADYLSWEVATLLKESAAAEDTLGK